MNMYSLSKQEVLKHLQTSETGLTSREAEARQKTFGPNALDEPKRASLPMIFLRQFADLLVVILLCTAVISLLLGSLESSLVIIAVLILNALLGTCQHRKAEKSLDSLKSLSSPMAKVIRDGVKVELPAREVVPGDILVLEAGDLTAADVRILTSHSLQMNESALTGEPLPVEKSEAALPFSEIALGDQSNMAFLGSLVTYGRGYAVVTGTGMNTELGKIADLMNRTKEKETPLQESLNRFSKRLAMAILILCGFLFLLSLYRRVPVVDSLMFAVALAVAAIPEALSSIVTIVQAIGTQKMVREHAIIKDLKAVETLGCVSVICSDKTGTLTQNRMNVQVCYANQQVCPPDRLDPGNPAHRYLLYAALLANDAQLLKGHSIGDPTETALLALGESCGYPPETIREQFPRHGELPFDSDRKLMSTAHVIDGKRILLTKGAPDILMERTTHILEGRESRPFTSVDKAAVLYQNQLFSEQGLRVLAFACRELSGEAALTTEEEQSYTFLGLIAMMDPPRPESAAAVAQARKAGIRTIMITGDHKVTASAIATQLDILKEGELAVSGPELSRMTDQELENLLPRISVYARVSPSHKIRIVDAWQRRGHITAMTGDGVNDAPALKKADIGIAMGITGTEVSKDAASMILTDDCFATIIRAVENGRNVYRNIKNAVQFLLSGNMAGILCVLFTFLMGLPVPFAPVHLLFINLVTDSLPALAIGMEPARGDLLNEKPRNPGHGILTGDFLTAVLWQGMLLAAFTMIAYFIGLTRGGAALASTMAFSVLTLARLFHGFNLRCDKPVLQAGLLTNRFSLWAFAAGFCLLNAILLVPALGSFFQAVPITAFELFLIYLAAFLPTLLIQAGKTLFRRQSPLRSSDIQRRPQ